MVKTTEALTQKEIEKKIALVMLNRRVNPGKDTNEAKKLKKQLAKLHSSK